MAAPCGLQRIANSTSESDDSSDSEEDNLAKLKEAAIDIIPISSVHAKLDKSKTEGKGLVTQKPITKPSLRPTDKLHDGENELDTTPEFRAHIAKKLSCIVESSITETKLESPADSLPDATESDSFKLFSTSQPGSRFTTEESPAVPRKRKVSSSDSELEEERLASVAVSGDFILAGSGIKVTQQNEGTNNTCSKSNTSESDSFDNRSKGNNCKKKKKKKSKDFKSEELSDTERAKRNENGSSTDGDFEISGKSNNCKKKKKKKTKDFLSERFSDSERSEKNGDTGLRKKKKKHHSIVKTDKNVDMILINQGEVTEKQKKKKHKEKQDEPVK